MTEEHIHDYWDLYAQPRIKENILLGQCMCGKTKEYDAQVFFDQAHKDRVLYLFDFNNTPELERSKDDQRSR